MIVYYKKLILMDIQRLKI